MNNTALTNNSYTSMWRFIESFLPNYSSRDDVLRDDILYRYIDGDDICDEDYKWILHEFDGDKELIKEELVRLEIGFIEESLKAYYEQLFPAQSNFQHNERTL